MCELVPIMACNRTIYVAEHKREIILKYIDIFPKFPEVSKVFLFGSALESRCTEDSDVDLWVILNSEDEDVYFSFLSKLWEDYEWSTRDDLLGCGPVWFERNSCGALRSVKKEGVLIYDSVLGSCEFTSVS